MCSFRLLASLFSFKAALRFGGGIGARFRFAFFRSFFVRGNLGLRVFLGLLLHSHDARFFGGDHNFTSGGFNGFFIALAGIGFFRGAELLFGLCDGGSGVFIGQSDVRDAHRVARFE